VSAPTPARALPWFALRLNWLQPADGANNVSEKQLRREEPYVLHACNAYPRLVAALQSCINAAHADKIEDFSTVSNAADDAAKLLRDLGEM
jgi:hypothetical protein